MRRGSSRSTRAAGGEGRGSRRPPRGRAARRACDLRSRSGAIRPPGLPTTPETREDFTPLARRVDERAIGHRPKTRRDTVSDDQDKRTDEAEVEDEDFEGHSFGGGSEPGNHGGGSEP